MPRNSERNRLAIAMDELGITAVELAQQSGVDPSLITKWRRGERKLTLRSKELSHAAQGLLVLDKEGVLEMRFAPYREDYDNDAAALLAYMLDEEIPGLAPATATPKRQKSGHYVGQYRVFLGVKEFRKATLEMMDYIGKLPPGREVVIICHGRYDLIIENLPFVLQFVTKLRKALNRDTRFLLVNRKGYSAGDTAAFAGIWLAAHLKGYIRSRYYDGSLPGDLRYVASIRGYWSALVEEDVEVEDGIYTEMNTDPRYTRKIEKMCNEYVALSKPASQYSFFTHPLGDEENERLWTEGPLPKWDIPDAKQPQGNFNAVCRIPGFGIIARSEFENMLGDDTAPTMPEYLFNDHGEFASGVHRILLCREDVQEGLKKSRRMHEPLSALVGRRVFVSREMLVAQLKRLISASRKRDDFEIALIPRIAFEKLQIEMVCYENSVSVAWLQDVEESVFADDKATSGSFHSSLDYAWGRLLAGWKRKRTVIAQLNKWIAGKDLDQKEEISTMVRNWDVLPRE